MQNSSLNVSRLISGAVRYEVPPFQREYEWDYSQWEGLWQDLGLLYGKRMRGEDHPNHFMGILLLDPIPVEKLGGAARFSVIDGQQRLTSIMVLLAAIRDANFDSQGKQLPKNHALYFVQDNDGEIEGPRLVVQETDQADFESAMTGQWRAWYMACQTKASLKRSPIFRCYAYFRLCIWRGIISFDEDGIQLPHYRRLQADTEQKAETIWEESGYIEAHTEGIINLDILHDIILNRLELLELRLTDADEDAPTIFESINAKRTELQQWDFIRNLIFTRFEYSRALRLFDDDWKPVQAELKKVAYEGLRSDSRDAFIYDYLIARGEHKKQGSISKNRGYEHLRERISNEVSRLPEANYEDRLEVFVKSDLLSAARCWPVAVGVSDTPAGGYEKLNLNAVLLIESIKKLSAGPAFPAVLHYVEGFSKNLISDSDLVERLQLIESFLARSILSKRPLSPMRSIFMGILDDVSGTYALDDLKRSIVGTASSPGPMPSDGEMTSQMLTEDYYGHMTTGTQLGAIFRRLERFLAGPAANPLPYGSGQQDMSVEHVFPQSCVNPPHGNWKGDLNEWGVSGEALAQRINRLGNLTLMTKAANSYARAKPFAQKKLVLSGSDGSCPHPILIVSSTILNANLWDAEAVDERTNWIVEKCRAAWPFPSQ